MHEAGIWLGKSNTSVVLNDDVKAIDVCMLLFGLAFEVLCAESDLLWRLVALAGKVHSDDKCWAQLASVLQS